ncbi:hypothetical protein F4777DRAFT_103427 [Nemania sp. FL0916]|nr:hypothetical protein F4777DRAFT_103427 [Nemania sp. FL0916]
MAGLPADWSSKLSEEPMTTQINMTQPQVTSTNCASHEGNGTGPHVTCEVERPASRASTGPQSVAESNETTKGVPTAKTSSVEDPAAGIDTQAAATGQKKKKNKGKSGKARRKITGFEEYYADAPVTPAEAAEKAQLYDPARAFSDRIEECIQRFRARRRLNSQRMVMFRKYLFLGGIDSSQRQFTGMTGDIDAMAEADTDQIRTMTAVDFVGSDGSRFYDRNHPEDWEVDFEAVAKGFLSRTMIDFYMYDEDANQIAADLIKNFISYVLMHDVCPEYTDNLLAARNVCETAPTQLRHAHELIVGLPGTFNLAARSLFCERQVDHLDQDQNYTALVQFRCTVLLWPLSEKASKAKGKILNAGDPATIELVSTAEKTCRVLGIERPRQKDKKMIGEELAKMGLSNKLKPAGFIRMAPAIFEHGWGNMPRPEEVDFSDAEEEEFILEDELLAKFETGMKIRMTVCELNIGIRFIKEVHDVRVSFDTFLPQYLMTDWKEPIPNERPPPSIHDPNAEEKAMATQMQADD